MAQVLNFTPHPVHICDASGAILKTFPSVGLVRLKATTISTGDMIEDVPVTTTAFGEPEGLPEAVEGTFLIVSQLVKSALPQRKDLVVPAEVVRDADGNIKGCKSFGV